ncbi:MAG TPA: 3-isopropylmalate dehydratase large subunit [Kofleriaceae bacterium]|nr:3-isopropylmalate dehydratase large subunit [Kofleriaceae bacterium]
MRQLTGAQTLLAKLWQRHAIVEAVGHTLLYIDRHLLHEGSKAGFEQLRVGGRTVRRPRQTFAFADHNVPTARGPGGLASPPELIALLDRNTRDWDIRYFSLDDPGQGIVHVVAPELGIVLPGMTAVCGDSHTSTCGALGALAFGIGSSEVEHVLATQTLWLREPRAMRVSLSGALGTGVTAKDLVLFLIARIGADAALGHVIEFAGPLVSTLSMSERMTICNMAVEAGARSGLVAPDGETLAFLEGRPYAPAGAGWQRLVDDVAELRSDPDAVFDQEVAIDAGEAAPMVTWGTNPEQAAPITAVVPDPSVIADAGRRAMAERALEYMGLAPGQRLTEVAIDRVFIGSCTNARIEDLRAAAAVLRERTARVPGIVVPGSSAVKRQAEAEGLDRVFVAAGLEWRSSGCSMCLAINGDVAAPGERCASTSNRNFEGRQGKGARTHLVSPAMAAAAAVTGRLTDVRELERD